MDSALPQSTTATGMSCIPQARIPSSRACAATLGLNPGSMSPYAYVWESTTLGQADTDLTLTLM